MSASEAYNFREASDLVHTAGLMSEQQLSGLGQEGYTTVVNLLPNEHEYAVAGEEAIVSSQGIKYYYIPVDFLAPNDDDYEKFEQLISQSSSEKIMVHCAANYRVSAFYAIYAYHNIGWSSEKAMEFISSVWSLEDHPAWKEFVSRKLCATSS